MFALCQAVRQQPGAGIRPTSWWTRRRRSVQTIEHRPVHDRAASSWAKIAIVAEEADEAAFWLEFFASTRLGDQGVVQPLLAEAKELRAIFAASYKTSRRGRKG